MTDKQVPGTLPELPDLHPYDLPEDPFWRDKMLIRHAVAIRGNTFDLGDAVRMLDEYGERMGCRRHGKLEYESWNSGHGITACFAIYDLLKFVEFTRSIERTSERRRVLAEVRRWPWWRRLFWRDLE